MTDKKTGLAVVVIGRNEGERLKRCLSSVLGVGPVVYVDSGSSDGSQEHARSIGVETIQLPAWPNFTAARARNVGVEHLENLYTELKYVQVVDGDCEMRKGWITAAQAALDASPDLAIVFGRRRERYPDRSIYNALCDDEWNGPIGDSLACGGDAMMRLTAFRATNGYDSQQIAGEEPDLSFRLRRLGWRIERIGCEMTWHDADLLRFGQWWRRNKRAGHAYAELAHKYPNSRRPDWKRSCRSIIVWGAVLPIAIIATAVLAFVLTPWWLAAAAGGVFLYPSKMARIAAAKRSAGLPPRIARMSGIFIMLGKFAEITGIISFRSHRLLGRTSRIIEYKGPQ